MKCTLLSLTISVTALLNSSFIFCSKIEKYLKEPIEVRYSKSLQRYSILDEVDVYNIREKGIVTSQNAIDIDLAIKNQKTQDQIKEVDSVNATSIDEKYVVLKVKKIPSKEKKGFLFKDVAPSSSYVILESSIFIGKYTNFKAFLETLRSNASIHNNNTTAVSNEITHYCILQIEQPIYTNKALRYWDRLPFWKRSLYGITTIGLLIFLLYKMQISRIRHDAMQMGAAGY